MHRFTLQAVMLFTLLTLPSAVLANATPITYNILNNPDLQNGWTLSGTITTDGTIGTIQANDILSWTWTITKGVNSFTASSTNPGAQQVFPIGITATAAGLLVHVDPTFGTGIDPFLKIPNGLQFFDSPNLLVWAQSGMGSISLFAGTVSSPTALWDTNFAIGPGSSSLLIASTSVPEPASLYLVGFGAVGVYVMGHKRRARRTATTGA
jgi:PEP-CTERM motif